MPKNHNDEYCRNWVFEDCKPDGTIKYKEFFTPHPE